MLATRTYTQDQDRTDENSLEVSYVTTTSHALQYISYTTVLFTRVSITPYSSMLALHPARLERAENRYTIILKPAGVLCVD